MVWDRLDWPTNVKISRVCGRGPCGRVCSHLVHKIYTLSVQGAVQGFGVLSVCGCGTRVL